MFPLPQLLSPFRCHRSRPVSATTALGSFPPPPPPLSPFPRRRRHPVFATATAIAAPSFPLSAPSFRPAPSAPVLSPLRPARLLRPAVATAAPPSIRQRHGRPAARRRRQMDGNEAEPAPAAGGAESSHDRWGGDI